jgi:protein gp37
MGDRTGIEWAHYTHNEWLNCRRQSPACKNCYIERSTPLRVLGLKLGGKRVLTKKGNRRKPYRWNRLAALSREEHEKAGTEYTRPRVFSLSLGDWLDDEVPIEWLFGLLMTVFSTPELDWLLVTKRPQNWRERLTEVMNMATEKGNLGFASWLSWWLDTGGEERPPQNVWIGFTAENQEWLEKRWETAKDIPAVIRFISYEPACGPLDLRRTGFYAADSMVPSSLVPGYQPRIDWVIAGGESGPESRPMHPQWAQDVRDQCVAHHVPFFFKQWGEWIGRCGQVMGNGKTASDMDPKSRIYPDVIRMCTCGGDRRTDNGVLPMCECGNGDDTYVQKVGKKAAGRFLDGKIYHEFPVAMGVAA